MKRVYEVETPGGIAVRIVFEQEPGEKISVTISGDIECRKISYLRSLTEVNRHYAVHILHHHMKNIGYTEVSRKGLKQWKVKRVGEWTSRSEVMATYSM